MGQTYMCPECGSLIHGRVEQPEDIISFTCMCGWSMQVTRQAFFMNSIRPNTNGITITVRLEKLHRAIHLIESILKLKRKLGLIEDEPDIDKIIRQAENQIKDQTKYRPLYPPYPYEAFKSEASYKKSEASYKIWEYEGK